MVYQGMQTEVDITGLQSGLMYRFRVTAFNQVPPHIHLLFHIINLLSVQVSTSSDSACYLQHARHLGMLWCA